MQRKNSGRIGKRTDYRENRNASATKAGPGRFHAAGKAGNRLAKPHAIRAYVALGAAWASKRVPKWRGPRDDNGAVCLIGKPYDIEGMHPTSREVVLTGWVDGEDYGYTVQRKWLGGISAQRGF
jgi:hypothetical protein